jgi:hypothetical protein
VPLKGGGVALKWLINEQYVTVGNGGVLELASAAEAVLDSPDLNEQYAFIFEPERNPTALRTRSGRVLGVPGGLTLGGVAFSKPPVLLLTMHDVDWSSFPNACGIPHAGRDADPHTRWEARQHARLVKTAFITIKTFNVTDHPELPLLTALYDDERFMNKVYRGLVEADTRVEAYVPRLFSDHFYNPRTGANFVEERANVIAKWYAWVLQGIVVPSTNEQEMPAPQVDGVEHIARLATARDQAMSFAFAAAQILRSERQETKWDEAAWNVGMALHYVTDLTQPMHAANFINVPGDSRHQKFETAADEFGHEFVAGTVTWDEVRPEAWSTQLYRLLHEIARRSLQIHEDLVKPMIRNHGLNAPFSKEQVAPVLERCVPHGVRSTVAFLVLWARLYLLSRWSGREPLPVRSHWAPNFVAQGGAVWVVVARNDTLPNSVTFWRHASQHVSIPDSATYEAPAAAVSGDTSFAAWHALSSRALYTGFSVRALDDAPWWRKQRVENAEIYAYTAPTVLLFKGHFLLIWAGTDAAIRWQAYHVATGEKVNDPQLIPDALTVHSPGCAVIGDHLWMAWTGRDDGQPIFWSRTRNLADWDAVTPRDVVSPRGPAIAAVRGEPCMFWSALNLRRIDYSFYRNDRWTPPETIPKSIGGSIHSDEDVRAATLGAVTFVGTVLLQQPAYFTINDVTA